MRALFLGLGGVGQRHLRNLRALRPEVEIAAVRHAGRRFEIGNNLAADMGVDIVEKYGVSGFPDLATALAWKPDLAVVSTPSSLHVAQTSALVAAGVPVFVEKPLATTAAGMDELYRLAEERAAKVSVGFQLRHHPCVTQLRQLLEQGRVGRPRSVEITVHAHMPSWHAYEKPNQFYAGRRDLGGGVILTEIHELDLLSWIVGAPKRVAAFGGKLSSLDIDVEDTVSASLWLQNGVVASITLCFVQEPPSRRFCINGENGRLVMEIPKLRVIHEDTNGQSDVFDIPDFDRNQMFVAEMREFLDWIDGGPAPSTTLQSVRAGQQAALAMLLALDEGRVVEI